MIVTQQEIDVFRAVLANRPEYQDAQEALDIIVTKKRNLEAAYPALALKTGSTKGEFSDELKKLAKQLSDKYPEQIAKIDLTRLIGATIDALFALALAYTTENGFGQGIAVAIVFVLLKQKL